MKATEVPETRARYLLTGGYGSGKTYMVGIMHEIHKKLGNRGAYLFDFDIGFNTLKTAGFDVEFDKYYDKDPDRPQAFKKAVDKLNEFIELKEKGTDPGYGVYAIDSLTSFQAAAMYYVMSINRIERRTVGKIKMTTQNDYGVLVGIMQQFLAQIVSISEVSDFVLTTHVREDKDDATGRIHTAPAISGRALPSQIGGYFNEVWYFEALYNTRTVQTAASATVPAKTQIAGMPSKCAPEDAILYAMTSYNNASKEVVRDVLDKIKREREDISKVLQQKPKPAAVAKVGGGGGIGIRVVDDSQSESEDV